MSGFARAIVKLRDASTPNVLLGYHISVWGARVDIALSNPPDATVDMLAGRAASFYTSLAARSTSPSQNSAIAIRATTVCVPGSGHSWWDADDFSRNVRFLNGFSVATSKRIVMWQIPLGNTRDARAEQHERSLSGQSSGVAPGRAPDART